MRFAPIALALAGVVVAGNAFAGVSPQNGSLNVSATVLSSCVITSPATLSFGNYDPAGANLSAAATGQGTVSVRCTKGAIVHMQLGQGANANTGSTCATPLRQMSAGGADRLGYTLYRNAARTQIFGCQASVEQLSSAAVGAGTPLTFDVYGSIPGAQDIAPGSYSDTVSVDITF